MINTGISQGLNTTIEAGSVGSTILTAVSGPISALIGTIKGVVSSARAHRARKRQNRAEQIAKENNANELAQQQLTAWLEQQNDVSDEDRENKQNELQTDSTQFLQSVTYLAGKNKAKKWRSILEASGAFTGVAGTTALTVGLIAGGAGLTALLASNPIGWGIALGAVGLGALAAIGYGFYKLAKSISKRNSGTKGVNRSLHAHNLYDLAHKGYQPSISFLQEMGVLKENDEAERGKFSMNEIASDMQEDKEQIIAYIMGKMKST